MKKAFVLFIPLILITVILSIVLMMKKDITNNIKPPFAFKTDNSLTVMFSSDISDQYYEHPLFILETKKNSKLSNIDNYRSAVLFDSDGKEMYLPLFEEVYQMDQVKIEKLNTLYPIRLTLKIPLTSNFRFKDAKVAFQLINDETVVFDLGSFNFINFTEDQLQNDTIKIRKSYPILIQVNDVLNITGLIVSLKINETIEIQNFDTGLSDYGIDTEKVYIIKGLAEDVYNSAAELRLNEIYSGIYDIKVSNNTSIKIPQYSFEPGEYTLVIPFTKNNELAEPIGSFGGMLYYKKDSEIHSYVIQSFLYIQSFNYSSTYIKEKYYEFKPEKNN